MRFLILLIVVLLFTGTKGMSQNVEFTNSPISNSREGHTKLEWLVDDDSADLFFIVEQSTDSSFNNSKIIYSGRDRATYISGLKNGTYFFRIKIEGNDSWADPVRLIVEHHDLKTAYILSVIGLTVFLATAVVLITGVNKTKTA